MNFKSSVVNTSFGRCAEHTIEVSVHHRHLLSCRLLELYKQSLLFSPRSLIGASLWNSSALTMNIRMYLYIYAASSTRPLHFSRSSSDDFEVLIQFVLLFSF